jgi:hypothetical protein
VDRYATYKTGDLSVVLDSATMAVMNVTPLLPRLASLIDETVFRFADEQEPSLHVIRRWHDADLWMLRDDEVYTEASIYSRRVTIGAYSDEPDALFFIPDVVVSGVRGRWKVPAEELKRVFVAPLSVADLTLPLIRDLRESADIGWMRGHESVVHALESRLSEAWRAANQIDPEQATQPVG